MVEALVIAPAVPFHLHADHLGLRGGRLTRHGHSAVWPGIPSVSRETESLGIASVAPARSLTRPRRGDLRDATEHRSPLDCWTRLRMSTWGGSASFRGTRAGRPDSSHARRQSERVARQRERPVSGGPLAGAGPLFLVAVKCVDGLRRIRTVSGLARQRGLAPGPARVWRACSPTCEEPAVVIMVLDAGRVDADLAAGALACPRCPGVLRPWSWAAVRRVRQLDGVMLAVRPRRARCSSCHGTQVLLPAGLLVAAGRRGRRRRCRAGAQGIRAWQPHDRR
jgi:hypothetical protein